MNRTLLIFLLVVAEVAKGEEPLKRVPATEPSDAIATFRLADGFGVELVAAEPLVTDPVAMAVDEAGLAYVAEMNDYPYSDSSHDKAWQDQSSEAIGRIRVLRDNDGDGVYDESWVFAENLSWPTGVAVWNGGLFVTATPDIWYLKDTNGDHRADVRRKILSGFRKYNVQAVMNNLQWGLDNHLYAAGASNGGQVYQETKGKSTAVRMGRHDFRLDPVTEEFELLSGGARFGHSCDDSVCWRSAQSAGRRSSRVPTHCNGRKRPSSRSSGLSPRVPDVSPLRRPGR